MDNLEAEKELYEILNKFRLTMLGEINKLPHNIKKEATVYCLKMLLIEMEHMPTIGNLYKLERLNKNDGK